MTEWFIVWCLVLVLVHIQFKNCVPFTVIVLKIVETSIITFIIKIWYIDGKTFKDMIFRNITHIEL